MNDADTNLIILELRAEVAAIGTKWAERFKTGAVPELEEFSKDLARLEEIKDALRELEMDGHGQEDA
jgi:hypothetical protein